MQSGDNELRIGVKWSEKSGKMGMTNLSFIEAIFVIGSFKLVPIHLHSPVRGELKRFN